jgi:hypothetical protein
VDQDYTDQYEQEYGGKMMRAAQLVSEQVQPTVMPIRDISVRGQAGGS